jgi:hypothetical protein
MISKIEPVQVNFPDDSMFSSDVQISGGDLTIKQSLPMTKNKPTVIVGMQDNEYVAKAKITAGPGGLTGKFKITITNALPAQYESKETFTLAACTTREFELNPNDHKGILTAIPFVAKKSEVHWIPEKAFEWTATGQQEILLEFAGKKVTKTTVEKVIGTVPFKILWKGVVLGPYVNSVGHQLVQDARDRSSGYPKLFIQANYPVENAKVQTASSDLVTVLDSVLTVAQWQALSGKLRQNILVHLLAVKGLAQKRGGFDRIVYVAQEGILDGNAGQANTDGDKAVFVVTERNPIIETHELGHTSPWRLDDEYIKDKETNELIAQGKDSIGFLATLAAVGLPAARPSNQNIAYGFMGIGVPEELVARKEQYRNKFIPAFDAATNQRLDPAVWILRAVVGTSGGEVKNVSVLPIYHFDFIPDNAELCNEEVNCTTLIVNMTLGDDSTLTKELAVHPGNVIDEFDGTAVPDDLHSVVDAVEIPPQGIKHIRLQAANGTSFFDTTVSVNLPKLDILSVNVPNNKKTISATINSSDIDGGNLFASFFIEDSAGNSDDIRLDESVNGVQQFTFNIKLLSKGNYNMSVLLTDGFNTVEEKIPFKI